MGMYFHQIMQANGRICVLSEGAYKVDVESLTCAAFGALA